MNNLRQVVRKKNVNKLFSQHIASTAGLIVTNKGFVSAIDLLIELGWLRAEKLAEWQKGKVDYLERIVTANLSKISKAMKELRAWAHHSKLNESHVVYKHKNYQLRFSKSNDPNIEKAYSTHYVLVKTNR